MKNLDKLFESEILSPDAKKEIKEAFAAAEKSIREELEVTFAKKLIADKQQMNIKLVGVIDEAVNNEIGELREDIVNARTLEVRYAKKLEEFKQEYTKQMNEALSSIIESYVKIEFKELRTDLLEAKKNTVLSKIFEAFADEFRKFGLTPGEKELSEQLEAANQQLAAVQGSLEVASRSAKLEGLLANLTGGKRDVMRVILENVAEDKLDERYNECVADVLNEEVASSANPITEGAKTPVEGKVVLANASDAGKPLNEGKESAVDEIRRLAGIKRN